jgi:hypothetical protein
MDAWAGGSYGAFARFFPYNIGTVHLLPLCLSFAPHPGRSSRYASLHRAVVAFTCEHSMSCSLPIIQLCWSSESGS